MTAVVMRLGPGKLAFGDKGSLTAAEAQVIKCKVKPSVKQGDPIHVLSGETVPGDRAESATLEFTINQDLGESKSFLEWTWANAGKTVPFEFIPINGKGKAVRGKVIIERGEIGGDVNEVMTTDLEFTCLTMPTIENEITGPGA